MNNREYTVHYLRGLSRARHSIERRQEQLEELQREVIGAKAIRYDKENIDQSPSNSVEDSLVRYLDHAREIEGYINYYVELKNRLMEQIEDLAEQCEKNGDTYSQVLYKIYVEEKKGALVARELGYTRRQMERYHRRALMEFYECFLKVSQDVNVS